MLKMNIRQLLGVVAFLTFFQGKHVIPKKAFKKF